MRILIFVVLLAFGPIYVVSQDSRDSDARRVGTLVRDCADERPKVRVLFRSFVASEGRLVKFDADSFYLKKGRKYYRSYYKDVLEIHCGEGMVTNVAEPTMRRYGSWTDINQVYGGTRILVVLTDGSSVNGFSNSATASHLIIFDNKTDSRRDIPKDQVAAFFGLVGGKGGVKAGAAKGSEGLLRPGGDPILGGVGAGIGAIIGALMKSSGRPVLVYSQ